MWSIRWLQNAYLAFNNKCNYYSLTFDLSQWNGMLLKYLIHTELETFFTETVDGLFLE